MLVSYIKERWMHSSLVTLLFGSPVWVCVFSSVRKTNNNKTIKAYMLSFLTPIMVLLSRIPFWRPVLSCYVNSVLLSPARWIFSDLSSAWEWLKVMIAALHEEVGKSFHFGRKGWGFRFSRGGKPSRLCVCSSLREHLLLTTNKSGVMTDGKVGEPEDHLSPFFQGEETTPADYPPYELVATYEMTKAVFLQCCQDAAVFSILLHLLPLTPW